MFGPILEWELTVLARRKRYFFIRMMYVGMLLMVAIFFYARAVEGSSQAFPFRSGTIQQATRFASGFRDGFLMTQLVIILILMPAYLAPAIAQERERKTLDYLLVSELSDREIVLGKWGARTINMVSLIIVGMAVPAMFSVIGGIDFDRLVIGSLAALFTLGSCSAIALFCSIYSSNVRVAFLRSYIIVGILIFSYLALHALDFVLSYNLIGRRNERFLSENFFLYADLIHLSDMINPVTLTVLLCETRDLADPFYERVTWFFSLHGGLMIALLSASCLLLRRTHLLSGEKRSWRRKRTARANKRTITRSQPSAPTVHGREEPQQDLAGGINGDGDPIVDGLTMDEQSVDHQKSPPKPLPPIKWSDDRFGRLVSIDWYPIFWREWYHGAALKLGVFFNVIIYLTLAGLLLIPIVITLTDRPSRSAEPFQFIWCWLMALVLLRISLQSATSISNERDRDCLDSMMTAPISDLEFVTGKIFGSLRPYFVLWKWWLPVMLFGTLTGSVWLISIPCSFAWGLMFCVLVAIAGVINSAWWKSNTPATASTLLTGIALMGGLHLAVILGAMATAAMLQLSTSSNTDLMEFVGYSFPWFLIGGSIFNSEQISRISNYSRDSIHPFTIATIHVANYFTLAAIGFDLALQSFKFRIARADDQQGVNAMQATPGDRPAWYSERALANLIDYSVSIVLLLSAMYIHRSLVLFMLISIPINASFLAVIESVFRTTPGKWLLGLHVVNRLNTNDGKHSYVNAIPTAFARQILKLLSLLMFNLPTFTLLTPFGKTMHDHLTGTIVMRSPNSLTEKLIRWVIGWINWLIERFKS